MFWRSLKNILLPSLQLLSYSGSAVTIKGVLTVQGCLLMKRKKTVLTRSFYHFGQVSLMLPSLSMRESITMRLRFVLICLNFYIFLYWFECFLFIHTFLYSQIIGERSAVERVFRQVVLRVRRQAFKVVWVHFLWDLMKFSLRNISNTFWLC